MATALPDADVAAQFGIPETMTTEQVASVMGVRETTVTQWARDGVPLRGIKIGNEWRFRVQDVQRLFQIFEGDLSRPVDIGPES